MTQELTALLDTVLNTAKGRKVSVLGLGVTGFSVADTLAFAGATVQVVAGAPDNDRERILSVIGVSTIIASSPEAQIAALVEFGPELIVVSPGIPAHHPARSWAAEQEIPVIGDIDVAWHLQGGVQGPKWILVTGTNGKTTTTELTAAMLNASGLKAAVCGNIGVPILDVVRDPVDYDVLVVEISSFQLHTLQRINPWSSVCLNVAADHLDWHGSAEAYRTAKAKVYEGTRCACVYDTSLDDINDMVAHADVEDGARAIGATLGVPGMSEVGFVDGILCDRAFLDERRTQALELASMDDLAHAGLTTRHLLHDAVAAAALARSAGATPAGIKRCFDSFHVDHHRIEVVGTWNDVTWINDSKATNPHAANASLESFDPVVWIVGGDLKGVAIADLVRDHAARLRGAVVVGHDRTEARDALATYAPDVPVIEITTDERTDIMREAVDAAAALAQPHDTVLLAPAAASWDQFTGYTQRGDLFMDAVRQRVESK